MLVEQKYSELKIAGKVDYDNIEDQIIEIYYFCRLKDIKSRKFMPLLNQTHTYLSNRSPILEYCVKRLKNAQIQSSTGNSEFFDQLWDQTSDSKVRMINCLILRIIHLVYFKERPSKEWKTFRMAQMVYKGNLTSGDAFIRLPQLLMLPKFEYHELTVDDIKQFIRSFPIDYKFVYAFINKCRELAGISSCVINSKIEFFVRESMNHPVQRIQIGELPTPYTVFMIVQRVNGLGEMIGKWESVHINSKEVDSDEVITLSPPNHLGDGTFSENTKILSQERIFSHESEDCVFINTPLKVCKVTRPIFKRVENWDQVKEDMKRTHLVSSPCVKHVTESQEFRLSSIGIKMNNGSAFDEYAIKIV